MINLHLGSDLVHVNKQALPNRGLKQHVTYLAKDERRRTIVEAALRLVADVGFGGITTRGVARETGVAVGLVHHYFRSLTELKSAALRHAAEQDFDWNEDLVAQKPLEQALLEMFDWGGLPDNVSATRIWISAADEANRSAEFGAVYGEVINQFHTQLTGVIAEGVSAGVLQVAISPAQSAWKILALATSLSDFQVSEHVGISNDQVKALLRLEMKTTLGIGA